MGEEERAMVLPNDVLLVKFDLTHGDENRLCIVGKRQTNEELVTVVNAFQGQKAEDIFKLLTTIEKAPEEQV